MDQIDMMDNGIRLDSISEHIRISGDSTFGNRLGTNCYDIIAAYRHYDIAGIVLSCPSQLIKIKHVSLDGMKLRQSHLYRAIDQTLTNSGRTVSEHSVLLLNICYSTMLCFENLHSSSG